MGDPLTPHPHSPRLSPLGEGKRRISAGLPLWCEWEPQDHHNYSHPPSLPTRLFHPSLIHTLRQTHEPLLSVFALVYSLAPLKHTFVQTSVPYLTSIIPLSGVFSSWRNKSSKTSMCWMTTNNLTSRTFQSKNQNHGLIQMHFLIQHVISCHVILTDEM